jgi:hypothetical protein
MYIMHTSYIHPCHLSQDLAATELEESFDHIDVVVKTADSASTVRVDGEVP